MDDFMKIMGGGLLVVGGLFLLIILGTLFGGIAGWVVGMVFDETIEALKVRIALSSVTDFQLGAMLGFVGGFFRASVSRND